jgi:uncharacterized protein (TIGR02118 family)
MHKLTILFEPPDEWLSFEQDWQKFLGLAEQMPGLRRELIGRVQQVVHGGGGNPCVLIHELLFDTKAALEAALKSPQGEAAGQWLQTFTRGRITLLISEHQEAQQDEFRRAKA